MRGELLSCLDDFLRRRACSPICFGVSHVCLGTSSQTPGCSPAVWRAARMFEAYCPAASRRAVRGAGPWAVPGLLSRRPTVSRRSLLSRVVGSSGAPESWAAGRLLRQAVGRSRSQRIASAEVPPRATRSGCGLRRAAASPQALRRSVPPFFRWIIRALVGARILVSLAM